MERQKMNITVVCIGKLKETYWTEAVAEYSKRLAGYCSLSVEEIKEEKLPDNASKAEEEQVIAAEGKRILKKLSDRSYVITLEIKGKELTSEALSEKLGEIMLGGKSDIAFVIGGSLGLSPEVSEKADLKLSFSRMTFPHQLMRVILLEQLYRSFKIQKNETYHK